MIDLNEPQRERQWSVVIEILRENGESEKNVISSVKSECRNVDQIFMLFWVKKKISCYCG